MNSTSTVCTLESFYATLFDPGQETCFSEHARGTSLYPVDDIVSKYFNYERLQYFSINAMKDKRADSNVVCFRNVLIENDKVPVLEQIAMVKALGLPYSTCTHSGNKSMHFIVSLETPLDNRDLYNFVVQWIYNIINHDLPDDKKFDTSTRNASRFSRVPGGTNVKRDDNGKVYHCKPQKLMQVLGRVPDSVMESWLLSHEHLKPVVKQYDDIVPSETANPLLLKKWTSFLLDEGINSGKRNNSFYEMAFDFIQAGYKTPEEAISFVVSEAKHLGDFPLAEIDTAFRSAYKRYYRDKNAY